MRNFTEWLDGAELVRTDEEFGLAAVFHGNQLINIFDTHTGVAVDVMTRPYRDDDRRPTREEADEAITRHFAYRRELR